MTDPSPPSASALGQLDPPAQAPTQPHPSRADAAIKTFKRLGPAAVLAVLSVSMPGLGGLTLLYFMNDVAPWIRDNQPGSILIYVLAFAVLSGCALLPTYAQSILGGWAFGFAIGFPAAQFGLVSGSIIAYAIARPTAGDRVLAVIRDHPRWEAVRVALIGRSYARTLFIVTLLRMPPTSPFAMTNLVLAGVKVPLSAYALGTFLGTLPRTAMTIFWASQVSDMVAREAAEQVPWWWIGAGITLSVLVLAVIGIMAKKALDHVTRPDLCPNCRYDIRGLPAKRCPECGAEW